MPLSLTDHRLAPVMAAAGPLDPDKRIVLMERIVASLKRQGLHRPTDYCGWLAGAREASMALIPKRASASRHRCHSDPAILRYAALQSPGTSRAFF